LGRLQFPHKADELLGIVLSNFNSIIDSHSYYQQRIDDNTEIYNNEYSDEEIDTHNEKSRSVI